MRESLGLMFFAQAVCLPNKTFSMHMLYCCSKFP